MTPLPNCIARAYLLLPGLLPSRHEAALAIAALHTDGPGARTWLTGSACPGVAIQVLRVLEVLPLSPDDLHTVTSKQGCFADTLQEVIINPNLNPPTEVGSLSSAWPGPCDQAGGLSCK